MTRFHCAGYVVTNGQCYHPEVVTSAPISVPTSPETTSSPPETAGGDASGNAQKTAVSGPLLPPLSLKEEKSENRASGRRGSRAGEVAPAAFISDHATIRFLERHYGLTDFIAAVREEIAHAAAPAIDFGATVVIAHGCRLVLREGIVITVLPKADCLRAKVRPHRRGQQKSTEAGSSE